MDNLKVVYKVLVEIETFMDSNRFDGTFLEALKISEERRNRILQSMIGEGLIDGFERVNYPDGCGFKAIEPRLTIKGMEFLQENSAMQKKNGLKDIKDVTPFINLFDTSFKGWYNTSIQMKSVRYTIYQGQKREELPLFPLNIISFYCLGIVLHNAI